MRTVTGTNATLILSDYGGLEGLIERLQLSDYSYQPSVDNARERGFSAARMVRDTLSEREAG